MSVTCAPGSFGRIVALSLAPVFCAAGATFPDYPVRPASDYAVRAEKAGIVIGIQPVKDSREQLAYFKWVLTSARPQNILPVFVVLDNVSSGDTFLFDMKMVRFNVDVPSKRGQRSVTPKAGVARPISSSWSPAPFGIPSTHVWDVNDNMRKKELASKTVPPGASMHGFLYIPTPAHGRGSSLRLQIPVSRTGTNDTVVLEVVCPLGGF